MSHLLQTASFILHDDSHHLSMPLLSSEYCALEAWIVPATSSNQNNVLSRPDNAPTLTNLLFRNPYKGQTRLQESTCRNSAEARRKTFPEPNSTLGPRPPSSKPQALQEECLQIRSSFLRVLDGILSRHGPSILTREGSAVFQPQKAAGRCLRFLLNQHITRKCKCSFKPYCNRVHKP